MISRVLTIFTFLLLFLSSVQAQTRFEKDSSWIRFEKMKDDTIKVMAYFTKSLHTSVNDIELSGFYAKKTYELASKLKYRKGIIYSCDLLGNHYLQKGKYDDAYKWMNRSLKIKEKKGDPFELAIGYNQIAVLFRTMENYETAAKYSHKAIRQAILLKNDRFIGLATSTLSNIFYEAKKLDSALLYSEKALVLHRSTYDSASISLTLTNQGVIYNDLKKYDLAIEKSKEGINYINSDELRLKLICESNLASSYLAKNDLYNAEKSLNAANQITKEFAETEQLMLIYKLNSELNFKKGNYKSAYEYQNKFQTLRDSIDNIVLKKDIANLEAKYQTAKKEKENQELKFQNEKKELELREEESKSSQLIVIIVAVGMVLVLLVFVILNRIKTARKLEAQNIQINRQNETLKSLNTELIQSEEELQKSDQAKAEILSIISHDISSPVNSLFTYQESVMQRINSINKEELTNDLFKINTQTKQLHALVNNLLDYCFTQQNGFVKNDTEIDLEKLVEENLELFRTAIEEKKLRINLNNGIQTKIKTDKNLFQLILRNLISNAIKFSPVGETIFIQYKDRIFSITNQGSILEKQTIEKLKSGNNTESKIGTSGEKGTGLGMKIVRNSILLLNSEFIIETHPQKGNRFGFRI